MKMMKNLVGIILILLLQGCASKKDIIYFGDADSLAQTKINYKSPNIQINDILDIKVSALIVETALPYNFQTSAIVNTQTADYQKLQGYLVASDGTITFPILGSIAVAGKSTKDVEKQIEQLLINGGHINNPTVRIRVINGKVTILGEVANPGTFNYSEENITLPQAIGYAGDLTIRGKRNNILIIREEDGVRSQQRVDFTKTTWFNSPYYYIKQNDIIVVEPNGPKVKSAGFVGDLGTFISVFSLALSTFLLIIR
jgi:polysaccharide export outer membrane protein